MCNINYHVVWCVKYRRKVITPQKEQFLKDPVQEIARDKGFTVHLFEAGEMDHIHCFVSAPPKMAITDIVKRLYCTSFRSWGDGSYTLLCIGPAEDGDNRYCEVFEGNYRQKAVRGVSGSEAEAVVRI